MNNMENRFKIFPSSLGWDIFDNLTSTVVINHHDKFMSEILCEALNDWNKRIDGECACNEAYDNGYEQGFEVGEDYGREKGYDEGYEDGKKATD